MLHDGTIINVYNYNEGVISVLSHVNPMGHTFLAATDDQPFVLPLTFAEIRFINGQSQVFREGFLKFEESMEKEVYETLQIHDWQNIWSEKEIEDIILRPSKEKLEKVVKIISPSLMERVRNVLVKKRNAGVYDISNRVIDVIEYRYQELYMNKKNSSIVIQKTKQEILEEEKETIKNEVIASELQKMKKELETKIRKELEDQLKQDSNKNKEEKVEEEKTKRGRSSSKEK